MNNAVYYVLVIVAGYFCGCIESGYLVGKLCGMDIRDYGSGNSGTTNVLRVLGKTRALLTFLGDALKSFIPVLVVKFLLCPAVPTLNADLIQLVTTRYVSLASILLSAGIVVEVLIFHPGRWDLFAMCVLYAFFAIYRHRANIGRLLSGTESKIGQKVEVKK